MYVRYNRRPSVARCGGRLRELPLRAIGSLLEEVERPALVVRGEKLSDKIRTVRTSRRILGDGAATGGPVREGHRPPRVRLRSRLGAGAVTDTWCSASTLRAPSVDGATWHAGLPARMA